MHLPTWQKIHNTAETEQEHKQSAGIRKATDLLELGVNAQSVHQDTDYADD